MKKSLFLLTACLLLSGCQNQNTAAPKEPATGVEATVATEAVTEATTEAAKEPEIIYRLNLHDQAFADLCVLSDSLYAYKLEEDTNWSVAKLEDHSVLEIQTGEKLLPYLQGDAFAFDAPSVPNNYLYDAEGNLLWEAEKKSSDACGPLIEYAKYEIIGYSDDVLSFSERKGFKTAFIDGLKDFDHHDIIQVIDFGRVHGMPFANGYLTTDLNNKTPFGIFNMISRDQERITLEYEDYYMYVYDSSVSKDGWIYVNFCKKNDFGKNDNSTVGGFYNVVTGEARFIENFYAVEIKHFSEAGNVLSSVLNGISVMYGEPAIWYGKSSEYIQDPPHYIVYDVEQGVILKEDVRDVAMSEDPYALVMNQDETWQYMDATTFEPISETYEGAALFQDNMGLILQDGVPAVIDRDFHVLHIEEVCPAEEIASMGHGYYKLKTEDGYHLASISVEIIE